MRLSKAMLAFVLQNGNLTLTRSKRSSRNSGAVIADRVVLHNASSAAAPGHLAAVHRRGSGAKTARQHKTGVVRQPRARRLTVKRATDLGGNDAVVTNAIRLRIACKT